jgi:hypothetical protein
MKQAACLTASALSRRAGRLRPAQMATGTEKNARKNRTDRIICYRNTNIRVIFSLTNKSEQSGQPKLRRVLGKGRREEKKDTTRAVRQGQLEKAAVVL